MFEGGSRPQIVSQVDERIQVVTEIYPNSFQLDLQAFQRRHIVFV